VDIAMLLRDVMTPLPMRAGWGQDMAWPYPGIPKTVVAELAGYEVAGLPFFPIETVTTDHGSRTPCSPPRWPRAGSPWRSRLPSSTTSCCPPIMSGSTRGE
jgi:hypothetical protein